MNVNGIIPASPVSNQTAAGRASIPTARTPEQATAQPEIDKSTGEPVAPHFPWLSRLTAQLEKASNRPSPYGSTVPLGENVDKKI